MSNRYEIDPQWIWSKKTADAVATLRLTIHHPDPERLARLCANYEAALPADQDGVRGLGGWACYPVQTEHAGTRAYDLVSGGEDRGDGISDAADYAYEHFTQDDVRLEWEQLPLKRG